MIDALRAAGVEDIVLVVGYKAELVRRELADEPGLRFVDQTEQLGTGHAVMVCREALALHDGPVLILTGDSPLTQASSIRSLLAAFSETGAACILGTAETDDPTGLGRVIRDGNGDFVGIVEEKDASPEQKKITEANMSTYVFECCDLLDALGRLTADNAQGEYYVTDCPGILKQDGKTVDAASVLRPCEALSINTLSQLAVVEEEMRKMELGDR